MLRKLITACAVLGGSLLIGSVGVSQSPGPGPGPMTTTIIPDTTPDEYLPWGPSERSNAVLQLVYIAKSNITFEIDYEGAPRMGGGVMRGIAVYHWTDAQGQTYEEKRNVSMQGDWAFLNDEVYNIVLDEPSNFGDDGLLVSWQWGPDEAGTTPVAFYFEGFEAIGTITATDSRTQTP